MADNLTDDLNAAAREAVKVLTGIMTSESTPASQRIEAAATLLAWQRSAEG